MPYSVCCLQRLYRCNRMPQHTRLVCLVQRIDALASIACVSGCSLLNGETHRFVADEFHDELMHSKRGTISMANFGQPNTNGSQFFVTLADNLNYLDKKNTVFGQVAEGLDVLDKLNEAFVDEAGRPLQVCCALLPGFPLLSCSRRGSMALRHFQCRWSRAPVSLDRKQSFMSAGYSCTTHICTVRSI